MKTTDSFKQTIQQYLEYRGFSDPLFAETLKKPNKNIDDCVTYVLNQVKDSDCNGFDDAEIFGMAVHYYDEDDIKPGDKFSGQVVVNHKVKLTAEEIEEQRQNAKDAVFKEQRDLMLKKPIKKKEETQNLKSLF